MLIGAATAGAAAAAAVTATRTASAGGTTATISYRHVAQATALPFSNLRLSIARHGRRLFAGRVRAILCRTQCWPALVPANPALRVVDLEGDASPDVILNVYSGGAHCCYVTQIYRYDPGTRTYSVVQHDFGDPGSTFQRLGPRFVFFSADARFAYHFAPFAFGALPVQIWTFAHGRFVDITRSYPKLIVVDAAQQYRSFVATNPQRDGLGFLAAWAADEDLLGRSALVAQRLAALTAAGKLRSAFRETRSGAAYVAQLQRFLADSGYVTS